MANLKEIRTRIASVKTTMQITSAMKMVSAAKLRKGQDAIIQMRPYAHKLKQILSDLAANVDSEEVAIYKKPREQKRVLLIAITSNKGLCGSFNSNIVKQVIADVSNGFKTIYDAGNADILAIGKKGAEVLKSKGYNVTAADHTILDRISFSLAKDIADHIVKSYLSEEYDLIKIYYNKFKNAANQEVTCSQYLPLPDSNKDSFVETLDYILEPTQDEIVATLIPKSLQIQFYRALLESIASEHGARMTAMHKATDNASDLIRQLQLDYNKARQASITDEILEIVAGAEALNG